MKDRNVDLKATRDPVQAGALRAQAMLESAARQSVMPQTLRQFADTVRKRMRADGGGTLAAISGSGVKSDTLGVPSFAPKWRMG